ncbi:hypothetical protein MMC25_007263 [Agyrium rufum]|nr:hypothetical protein [Agyrium rufum]
MASLHRALLTILLVAVNCNALTTRAVGASLPPTGSCAYLGQATSNFPNVTRDGGGGGTINGENLIIFSDTQTYNGNGALTSFVSNSIAFSDPNNSLNLTDFGTVGHPKLAIPFFANESNYCTIPANNCSRVVIWPGTSIATLNDGVTGVFSADVASIVNNSKTFYSTLVTVTASPSGYVTNRTVPQLFYPGELHWGVFSNMMNPISQNLNFFAKDSTGIKVAQVLPRNYADRSKYTYWTGSSWSPTPPARDDTSANIINGTFFSGDFFYSQYYQAFLFVYYGDSNDPTMGGVVDTFFIRYALGDGVKSAWSDQIRFCGTTQGTEYNYAGHAYPSFDPSGKTLLLSYSYNGAYNHQSLFTFT